MSEEYELALDIVIEILKRLPMKSLIKFTSVSKSWKSIIRSSQFITDYNSRRHIQPPPHHLLFVGDHYENYVDIFDDDADISFLQRLTLPMSAEHPDFKFNKLIGYSQGLFGFHCYNNVTLFSAVVIWNPSIRKSVVIPVPKSKSPCQIENFGFTVCNATDPTIFRTTYIVGSRRQVEIFTLSTGDWRTLSNAPRESIVFTQMRVMIDRFIHWIACEGDHYLILSFDITSEQFTEVCLPPSLAAHTSSFMLDLSKLRESLVVLEEDIRNPEIGVWMMMEPGVQNSFRKLYTVKPPYTTELFPTVLGFRKNGQPIIYLEFSIYKGVVRFYEPDLERFNDIEIAGYGPTAGSYMETLLMLDH